MSISAYTFNASGVVSQTTLVGHGAVIAAAKGARYRFVDANGNLPKGLKITLVGNDAKVEWQDADSPAGGKSVLTLENFSTTPDVAISAPNISPADLQGFQLQSSTGYFAAPQSSAAAASEGLNLWSYEGAMGAVGALIAINPSGRGGGSTPDTTPPPAPSVAAIAISRDTTPVISGTAEAGAIVRVTVGGAVFTTTASSAGAWSIDTTTATPTSGSYSPNANGANPFSVTATDAAGNTSAPTNASFTLDTSTPAPTIAAVATDNVINAAEQGSTTLAGTAEANATVTITLGGVNRVVTANAAGAWSYALTATDISNMGQGAETITISSVDALGNASTATTQAISVDTVAPALSTLALAGDADKTAAEGQSASGVTTLTAEAGAAVVVSYTGANGAVIVVPATGTGTVQTVELTAAQVTALGQGAVTVSATATDAAGNATTQSGTGFTLDTIAPSTPTITAQAVTNDTTPVINGTAEAGSTVTVTVGGATFTTTASGVGAWSINTGAAPSIGTFTPIAAGTTGSYAITVSSTDTAGNTTAGANGSVAIDTARPTIASIAITSTPTAQNYATGDTIEITITFSEAIARFGNPFISNYAAINIDIGGTIVTAQYASRSGNAMVLTYEVQATELDANGIAIVANSFNGGNFGDLAGNPIGSPSHAGIADDFNQRVNYAINTVESPNGNAGNDDATTLWGQVLNGGAFSPTAGHFTAFGDGTQPVHPTRNRLTAGNDTVDAGLGTDFINLYAADLGGSDTLNGGAGSDTVNYDDLTTGVTVNMLGATYGSGSATLAGGGFETLLGIEGFVLGQGADSYVGSNSTALGQGDLVYDRGGSDEIRLGDGADTVFDFDTASDTLDGGAGVDWLLYSGDGVGSFSPVRGGNMVVNLTTGVGNAGNSSTADTLIGFENVQTGSGDDEITGNALGNILIGGAGVDLLDGLDGDDTLIGGDGDDVVYGGNGADSIGGGLGGDYIEAGDGADTVFSSPGNHNNLDDAGNSYYGGDDASIDVLDLSARTDDLIFTVSDNGSTSNPGDHTGAINYNISLPFSIEDFYFGFEKIIMGAGSDGFYTYYSANPITNSLWVDGWTGSDTIYGGLGDDTLFGGEDNDFLSGAEGVNYLYGGNGYDTFDSNYYSLPTALGPTGAHFANNFIVFGSVNGEIDYLQEFESLSLSSLHDTINLSNYTQNIDLNLGNGGSDSVASGSGNNAISGIAGGDTIFAGAGSDVMVLNGSYPLAATDILDGEAGIDALRFEGTYASPINFDALVNGAGTGVVRGIEVLDFSTAVDATLTLTHDSIRNASLTEDVLVITDDASAGVGNTVQINTSGLIAAGWHTYSGGSIMMSDGSVFSNSAGVYSLSSGNWNTATYASQGAGHTYTAYQNGSSSLFLLVDTDITGTGHFSFN